MRISSLVKKNNYVTVTFESNEKLRLHYEVVMQCGLRKNDELSEKELDDILQKEEVFKLKNTALRVVARRPHSSFELKTKLLKKGFEKTDITPIIDDFVQKGYISDRDFAFRYADEALSKKKGLMKIKGELISKGVSREIIDEVINNLQGSDTLVTNAKIVAEKKFNSLKRKETDERKLKQKLYSHLNSKGYDHQIIREVIDDIIDE